MVSESFSFLWHYSFLEFRTFSVYGWLTCYSFAGWLNVDSWLGGIGMPPPPPEPESDTKNVPHYLDTFTPKHGGDGSSGDATAAAGDDHSADLPVITPGRFDSVRRFAWVCYVLSSILLPPFFLVHFLIVLTDCALRACVRMVVGSFDRSLVIMVCVIISRHPLHE